MRKWPIVVVLLAAVGGGWIGPVGDGAAAAPVLLSTPRAVTGTPATPVLPTEERLPDLEAVLVAEGLDRPTSAVAPGDGRLFVTEKSGVIRVVDDGVVLPDPLLDLDDAVPDHRPERGLLAIALHPDFAATGRFFVHLTDLDGDSRLIEYRMSADPNIADPTSARLILKVDQPGEFHNGGMLQFGPDGYLYVSIGDGGFGDPDRNGRLRENMLGSILRIDVDAGKPYTVPADNPYVGTPLASEIWLSGMRNPWRFFIDPVNRQIVIGDVGQLRREEVTVLPLDAGGLDLGWPIMEGDECYQADSCDSEGLVMPDVVYSHSSGCAVIGGPLYRGASIPELQGMVVYADFCSGRVRAFFLFEGHVLRHLDLIAAGTYGPILSLALDEAGEVLLLTEMGEVRRLQRADENDRTSTSTSSKADCRAASSEASPNFRCRSRGAAGRPGYPHRTVFLR
ncbi:MAG: PQQ-dependent sugar dehydrogenase [Acidimicrobiia bacterium]